MGKATAGVVELRPLGGGQAGRAAPIIPVAQPEVGDEEKKALQDVIDSGWLTMGDRVAEFERAFATAHHARDAVAVNSCTAGLHLCLRALGVQEGDEVLVPSLTFVATVNAVLYVGATPVFVDVESLDKPHIAVADAERKRSEKTKAAIVMHYGGYLVDRHQWTAFAERHGIPLIEDAAHACGISGVGAIGAFSVFSFFGNKNMTTAEGGMVLARDQTMLDETRSMRGHGMTTGTLQRHRGHAYDYDVTILGYNYRMDELRAAIGLVQLAKLPEWNDRRRKLTEFYRERLAASCPHIDMPFERDHESAHHLFAVLLDKQTDRRAVMEYLRREGIQTSIHYPPVHRFSYFRERFSGTRLPVTEEFSARVLTLPLYPSLQETGVARVIAALAAVA